jgi:phosphatidylserine/phosphatidylglycerophosphate/cardiolipin synthase-like enzyme
MTPDDVDPILLASLDDHVFSRAERRALKERLDSVDDSGRAYFRFRAFEIVKQKLRDEDRALLGWLEEVVKAVAPAAPSTRPDTNIFFSPGDECVRALIRVIDAARTSIDVCVFTITDDRLAAALAAAHERGVAIRIMTDDDKSLDRGSDVERLAELGVKVVMDDSEHHMHHKFAVFDRLVVATGSYNWTRSAAAHNRENLVVTNEANMVALYARGFDRLWDELSR